MRKIIMGVTAIALIMAMVALPALAEAPAKAQVQQEVRQQARLQSQSGDPQAQLQVHEKVYAYLKARYEYVDAKADFTTGVMSDVVSMVPQAEYLNRHIDQLENDMAELYTYVEACDVRGFNDYASGALAQDYDDALHALKQAYSSFYEWGVSTDTVNCLREKYAERHEAYKDRVQAIVIIKPDKGEIAAILTGTGSEITPAKANALAAAISSGAVPPNAFGKAKSMAPQISAKPGYIKPRAVGTANATAIVMASPATVDA